MRKGMKGAIVCAVVLAVAGVAATTYGVATGALGLAMDLYHNQENALNDIVSSGVLEHIPGGHIIRSEVEVPDEYSPSTTDVHQVFAGNEIQGIQASMDTGNVKICSLSDAENVTDQGEFQVDVAVNPDCDNHMIDVLVEDGILYIGETMVDFASETLENCIDVTLYLPEGMELSELDLNISVGHVEIDTDLACDNAEIEIGTGDIQINNNLDLAKGMTMNVSVGDVLLDNTCCTGNCVIAADVGNISLNGDVQGEIQATCGNGNVTIQLAGTQEMYDYDLRTEIGTLTMGEMVQEGMENYFTQTNEGNTRKIVAKSDIGDVSIIFGEEVE